jgi:ribosome-associated translation inhibitor RaiA
MRCARLLRTAFAIAAHGSPVRPGSAGSIHAPDESMPFSTEVRFRDMETSPALEEFVRRWATKLARVHERIASCAVVIERPHQSHRHGQRIHVRIALGVPGADIVVSHGQEADGAHEDAYVAVRDAFRAARRQLAEAQRYSRGGGVPRAVRSREASSLASSTPRSS